MRVILAAAGLLMAGVTVAGAETIRLSDTLTITWYDATKSYGTQQMAQVGYSAAWPPLMPSTGAPSFTAFMTWTDTGAHYNTSARTVWTDEGAHYE